MPSENELAGVAANEGPPGTAYRSETPGNSLLQNFRLWKNEKIRLDKNEHLVGSCIKLVCQANSWSCSNAMANHWQLFTLNASSRINCLHSPDHKNAARKCTLSWKARLHPTNPGKLLYPTWRK
jgi:hypothetical protein